MKTSSTEPKDTASKAAKDYQKGYEPYPSEYGKTGIGPQGRQKKTSHQNPGERARVYNDEESE